MPVIVPEETPLTAPYWEGARQGELRLQHCTGCEIAVHPPQPVCPSCHTAAQLRWRAASGTGTVYAITVVEHAAHPAVTPWLPYTVLLIRLDEGPLLISAPTPRSDASGLAVGARVNVVFAPILGTNVALAYMAAAETGVAAQIEPV